MLSGGYVEPEPEAIRALLANGPKGPLVMLNLLRFRALADYSKTPELAGAGALSGAAAYRLYMAHTTPFVAKIGGELLFLGDGAAALIGPGEERWDLVLLMRYPDIATFIAFATDPDYLKGIGHRTAALEDSRLFPLSPRSTA